MRVLRVSHSAVVADWRAAERIQRRDGTDIRLLSAAQWEEGGHQVRLESGPDDFVAGVRTLGRHPNLFLYDPRPIWALLKQDWDVLDLHEEPYSAAVAEVLLLRLLRRRTDVPFVMYSAQNIHKRFPPPFNWSERFSLRNAAAVQTCNAEAARIVRQKGLRGPATVIPLGVDLALFEPRERLSPRTDPRLGYVGRLANCKGVHVLINALPLLPDAMLEVYGSGPEEQALRTLAAELDVTERVAFRGFQSTPDLATSYHRFDLLVVPSLPSSTWEEQFCRVAVEAMACGVPVVASRSGALPEVLGTAGVLVTPGDPAALAAGIEQALSPAVWPALRAAGLKQVERYSWGCVARERDKLYQSACAGRVTGLRSEPDPRQRGLVVLVVAYGAPELLQLCLTGVAGQFDVLVVDNSSSPHVRAVAKAAGVRYLDPGKNLGFAGGVNRGLATIDLATHDVLLLNPDAHLNAQAVRDLHAALGSKADLAAVAPAQVDAAGVPARVSWPFPSPVQAWRDALGCPPGTCGPQFLIGSVLLVSGAALADVGSFDERFFLYSEETDWQRRAGQLGWRVELRTDVQATHVGAGTGGSAVGRELMFTSSLELYVRKHFGRTGWQFFRSGVVAGAAVRVLLLRGTRRDAAKRRLRIYVIGPSRARRAHERTCP